MQKFHGFTGDEHMLSFSLSYGGSLNKVWRSAAENAVKLLPKNAALRVILVSRVDNYRSSSGF